MGFNLDFKRLKSNSVFPPILDVCDDSALQYTSANCSFSEVFRHNEETEDKA
jgi:hypothetical protein